MVTCSPSPVLGVREVVLRATPRSTVILTTVDFLSILRYVSSGSPGRGPRGRSPRQTTRMVHTEGTLVGTFSHYRSLKDSRGISGSYQNVRARVDMEGLGSGPGF